MPADVVSRSARAEPVPFLPLSRPSLTEAEIEAVNEVLRSGWLTTGPRTAEFEARFAERVGARAAVAVSSGTAGMHLALHALELGPDDDVVTPSLTWVSTVNQIVLSGARPVFADVDRETGMVTRETLEQVLTPRTRLIVPTHLAGAALDLDPIRALARERGVGLVEDAAHAIGTDYAGEPVGARGTAVFSFHPTKNLTTAEGGMVASDDADLLTRVRRLRFHGLGVDAFDRRGRGRAPQAEVLEPGFKYNLTDLAAALGLCQLERLDELVAARARLADHYRSRLADVKGVEPLALPTHAMRHAWHLLVIRVEPERAGLRRDELMARLLERGIETGLHFRAVHTQRYYRERFPDTIGRLPATEWLSDRVCSLPLYPDLTPADVDRVVDSVRELAGG